MAKLGTSGCSVRSCIESPTSHQQLVVYSRANNFPKIKKQVNCTKCSFLGAKSGTVLIGSGVGIVRHSGGIGVQISGISDLLIQVKQLMMAAK